MWIKSCEALSAEGQAHVCRRSSLLLNLMYNCRIYPPHRDLPRPACLLYQIRAFETPLIAHTPPATLAVRPVTSLRRLHVKQESGDQLQRRESLGHAYMKSRDRLWGQRKRNEEYVTLLGAFEYMRRSKKERRGILNLQPRIATTFNRR